MTIETLPHAGRTSDTRRYPEATESHMDNLTTIVKDELREYISRRPQPNGDGPVHPQHDPVATGKASMAAKNRSWRRTGSSVTLVRTSSSGRSTRQPTSSITSEGGCARDAPEDSARTEDCWPDG
ncbi:hypothetical protein OIE68_39740 [Nocardia vinacea]|uniref:hypothetical protein n=1 Tax=Nocardia vinacea TaxID=96468 RepID=UPI002E113207|nr:hypothetical protein OIE68_39740 [Nocardia vinacea]